MPVFGSGSPISRGEDEPHPSGGVPVRQNCESAPCGACGGKLLPIMELPVLSEGSEIGLPGNTLKLPEFETYESPSLTRDASLVSEPHDAVLVIVTGTSRTI